MKILVTGSGGFIGRSLSMHLKREHEILAYDLPEDPALLEDYCAQADFVFHLAGVNRPRDPSDFIRGNVQLTAALLDTLKRKGNFCPVMLASSIHAAEDSPYGSSKRAAEELVFAYGKTTGAKTLVYRFPNVFGKWCRPDYNSAVATFCHNMARGLPITVHDPSVELELLYIDDLVEELELALQGRPHRCEDGFCRAGVTHRATLAQITALLRRFADQPVDLTMPEADEFARKLHSTYISYLPPRKLPYGLTSHADGRGSFTELIKTDRCGQLSVSVTKPGIIRGNHWHRSKWELFMVVSGSGLIRLRRVDGAEILEYPVSAGNMSAVHIPPGYVHSLINTGDTEDMITVIWANEPFDPEKPDTYSEEV